LKIAILNSHDNVGGAAKAMYRLHKGLKQLDVDSKLIVREKHLKDPNSFSIKRSESDMLIERAVQKYCIDLNRTTVSNTFFSFNYGNLDKELLAYCSESNVINLHWVDHFISNRDLATLVNLNKPIVWTLHDQRALTGGCHYSAGCVNYINDCGDCHMLIDDRYHLPSRVLKQKQEIINHANITVVSPSKWLAAESKKSRLFSNSRIEVIPNAVDTGVYQQFNKHESKLELGINTNAVVMQFGAQNGGATRKGFRYLLKSLHIALENKRFREKCKKNEVIILCLGQTDDAIAELPVKKILMGYVDDEETMAKMYSATDVFILPSIEDNLPNTILESMACGTQVIGFDTGGFSDIVSNKTGLIVEKGNCEKLALAIIDAVLNDNDRNNKNNICRSIVENNYTLRHQAEMYRALFEDCIEHDQQLHNKYDLNNFDDFHDVVKYATEREQKENRINYIEYLKRKIQKALFIKKFK